MLRNLKIRSRFHIKLKNSKKKIIIIPLHPSIRPNTASLSSSMLTQKKNSYTFSKIPRSRFNRIERMKSPRGNGSISYLHHQRDRHQPLTLVLRLAHIVIQFRVVPVHLYLEQRETRGT